MRARSIVTGLLLIVIAPAIAGCGFSPFDLLNDAGPGGEKPDLAGQCQTSVRVSQNLKNKVDILFMIDSSNTMEPMTTELRNRFPQLLKVFSDLALGGTYVDLHIGVIDSDYGAGATGAPGCTASGVNGGGTQGKLQAIGKAAPMTCKRPVGANYIHYAFRADGSSSHNLPTDAQGNVTQDLVQTFSCMAQVGANGCGFEHVLESTYAALRNPIVENRGFVRDDALLVVVFVTNEDDCSAPPDSDLFDKNKAAQYGYLGSYRCARFGVQCAGSLLPYASSGGPLDNCEPATSIEAGGQSKLYDVSRYIDFFTKPARSGGVKANPLDVVLIAVDGPADPVEVILSDSTVPAGTPFVQCPQLNDMAGKPCIPLLQHSCRNDANPAFFGDPAVRINTVVKAAANHGLSSICDPDYGNALAGIGNLLVSQVGLGCIPRRLTNAQSPDCVSLEVTNHPDGTQTMRELPRCSGQNFPCWKLEQKPQCELQSPDKVSVTIDRNGMAAPDNTYVEVSCETVCD